MWVMDISGLLLYDLRAIQLSPNELQKRLQAWRLEVSTAEIVTALQAMKVKGWVDGPGISKLHYQPVWLTSAGKAAAKWNIGDEIAGWRRVA